MKIVQARAGYHDPLKPVTLTRIIRVELSRDGRRDWFDLGLTTEMEAYVRIAGAPDGTPWESGERSNELRLNVRVSGVAIAREDMPVAEHPRFEVARLEAARDAAALAEKRARLGTQGYEEWVAKRGGFSRDLQTYKLVTLAWIDDEGGEVRWDYRNVGDKQQAEIKQMIDVGAIRERDGFARGQVPAKFMQITDEGRDILRAARREAAAPKKSAGAKWQQSTIKAVDESDASASSLHDE